MHLQDQLLSAFKVRYSLLKLWALGPFPDQRVSISNQSRKRVSLRGEEVPACCYLCWSSALVTESLLLQAVLSRSPGELFILVAGWSPTLVGSEGSSLRQPGRRGELPEEATSKAVIMIVEFESIKCITVKSRTHEKLNMGLILTVWLLTQVLICIKGHIKTS